MPGERTVKGGGGLLVDARHGDDKASTTEMRTAERSGDLSVPFRNTVGVEGIALGYRAEMFELSDGQGHGGAVATGSGFGSDFIVMDWTDAKGQRHAGVVRGLDLLRAWVATFAPEEAKDFPKGLAPPPGG
jgi:hypothetical protein